MTSGPVRTCAGCGRKAPKAELLRFVAREGALTPGAEAPGRGVYTCRRLECFERAASNRGFNRTLRTPVQVGQLAERLRLEFERIDRSVQTDTRETDGHTGKAGMASNGIASDASAVRPDGGTASGA